MKVKNCTLIKPLSCKKEDDAVKVAKILSAKRQRRIIVVDRKGYPVGIISTTDMSNKVVAEGKNPSKIKAERIMSSPIYLVCDMEDGLNDIFARMVRHESFFCPVTKNKKLYGILTYGELFRQVQGSLLNGKN